MTRGADKGYVAKEFIAALGNLKVKPNVAQDKSARHEVEPDERPHRGLCAVAAQAQLIDQGFGWVKSAGRILQVMLRGIKKLSISVSYLRWPPTT